MKQSRLFPKRALKEVPKDEESLNAQFLIRGGFIDKTMAGVYTYLPLGFRVLKKIEQIVREEMNSIGAQELLMPSLHPKEYWIQTNRWDSFDVLFKLDTAKDTQIVLGPTHEEVITPLARKYIFSYKDFPMAVYQIQNKFRNELRSRSGLLRGREFLMKDLYSFHVSQDDLDEYYISVTDAYEKIWGRVFIAENTMKTYASGGDFSKYSHEFQTISDSGEDTVHVCHDCHIAVNDEIIDDVNRKCPECDSSDLVKKPSIEVGNIFKLSDRFSKAFGFEYADAKGAEIPVIMASYGIGISRLMASIVEIHHDDKGIIWPKSVTPYHVHLLNLKQDSTEADAVYETLQGGGFSVLYDDRDKGAGEKFAEADLIGISVRLVISEKTDGKIEWKERSNSDIELIDASELLNRMRAFYTL